MVRSLGDQFPNITSSANPLLFLVLALVLVTRFARVGVRGHEQVAAFSGIKECGSVTSEQYEIVNGRPISLAFKSIDHRWSIWHRLVCSSVIRRTWTLLLFSARGNSGIDFSRCGLTAACHQLGSCFIFVFLYSWLLLRRKV